MSKCFDFKILQNPDRQLAIVMAKIHVVIIKHGFSVGKQAKFDPYGYKTNLLYLSFGSNIFNVTVSRHWAQKIQNGRIFLLTNYKFTP